MKKTILRAIGLALLAGLLLTAAGCASPATETVPPTEAPTEPTACTHLWEDGSCTRCAEVCSHVWDAGQCTVCGSVCPHEAHDLQTRQCSVCGETVPHEFVKDACTRCTRTKTFTDTALPDLFGEPCELQGTVEKLTYNTYAYSIAHLAGVDPREIPVEKYAYVYLPNGYTPDKEYDILYLMHGIGGSPGTWFGIEIEYPPTEAVIWFQRMLNMLDHLMASGEVAPTIIVTPSFYSYVPNNSPYAWANTKDEIPDLARQDFALEVPAILEAAETRYSTYAHGDVSRENLHATRAHRGYAGLSQGSVISLQSILPHHMDVFGYLGSLSGSYTGFEWVQKYMEQNREDILFWYHGEGSLDPARWGHGETYQLLLETFPEQVSEDKNMLWVMKEGYEHNAAAWYIDLYNMLHLFFLE